MGGSGEPATPRMMSRQSGTLIGRTTHVLWPEQSVLHREESRCGTTGDADARVDVLHVMLGGTRRDAQSVADRPVRQPGGQDPEYLDLAPGQAGGGLGAARGPALGGRDDGLDRVRVQVPGAYARSEG